ncbi:lipoprotein signal peptidase [Massilia violaceinigra]|uniref:Lipoprotein signal peptidase n=1 Tax=Massilia violaceinigra TaxID=2045208 RepID=A0ABY4A8B8_9BURK|nr:signal peptidase II [Massilia violaceinigra]UOD30961.1 lipoprotein signal peptidase [Massilia violaceinigra]
MATKKKQLFSSTPQGGSGLMPWLGIAAIVILLDQLTKIAIQKTFVFGEEKVITSFFNLVLAYNKGAAFGFLNSQPGWQRYFFTGVAVIAVGFILYMLKRHAGQRLFCWALALIMGGAIGNAIDRLAYGHVVDFLDFHIAAFGHFPAFNVADSAICIGAALFVFDELRRVNRQ